MIAPLASPAGRTALLRFIAGYQAAHAGVSPTLAECAIGVGAGGKGHVHTALVECERRGLIRRLRGKHRAIELLVDLAVPGRAGSPLYLVPQRRDPRFLPCTRFDRRRLP